MSWVTLVWSMAAALCFTLAGVYLLVWLKQWEGWEYLLFACSAASAGVIAELELIALRAGTGEQYGALIRWAHLPLWVLLISAVWFVHLYLRAGRRWLVWTVCGFRTMALALNFLSGANLNFRDVTGLRHFSWWGGEHIVASVGVPNPWTLVGQLGLLFFLIFLVDVTITVWRRGDRRRALLVSGSAVSFITLILCASVMVGWGILHTPFFVSFAYMGMIAAMGYELSDDLLRAAQLSKQFQASEAALRESEARTNLAAHAANLGLWFWNIRDDKLWVTQKWRELFGFADSEPVTFGRLLQVVHPEDREGLKQVVRDVFEHGGENETEYRIVRSDGSTRWISGYGTFELDESGKPTFGRGVSRDITKRKIVEEELRESEARFRTVADAAPVLIWMSGPDKLCTFFNKGWLDFTGRSLEQELGNGWAEGVHWEDIYLCSKTYQDSFDARQPFTMEYRLRRSDGEYRWVLDTGTPRFAPDGAFLGYIGSCIDITERRSAESEQQRQHMELARVGRVAVMGELTASLAHEINNPIGAIVTNANAGQRLLAIGKIDAAGLKELLGDIAADGRRAGEIVTGIRNMVRKEKARRIRVRIEDVIRELLRIVHGDAIERSVRMTVEVDSDAGTVWGDPVQLLQVLLNLTINAFEAMTTLSSDQRRLVIWAGCDENGGALVRVQDSGPGFPAGMAERLFEAFFSTKAEGTGMGLAIARNIIDAHGGKLSARNHEEGGACFTVRLPRGKEDKSNGPDLKK